MGNPLPEPPPGFDGLSTEDKIEYVQALWDRIASDAEAVPLADWQKKLLDERLDEMEENPGAGISWDELHARLLRTIDKK